VYTSDFWFRLTEGMERGEMARYARGGWGTGSGKYECFEIGVEIALADPVARASQLPESMEVTNTAWLTHQMELKLENVTSTALFKTGVWGKDVSGVASGANANQFIQWSDFANSDPVKDIRTARDRVHLITGVEPNNAFTSHKVLETLIDHPLLTTVYRRNSDGPLQESDVAAALGLTLEVGRSVHDTGKEGADDNNDLSRTATFSNREYIWGDHMLIQASNTPQLGVAHGAYTYIWDEAGNVPWALQLYRDDSIRADIRRAFTWPQVVVVSPHHGYFLNDVIA